jgi:flagellar biogenesis protein FliO
MGAGSALAGVDLLRTGLALAFCLALGIGAIFVIRRSHGISGKWLPEAATRRLRVVESTRLSARASLHLVEYGNRTVLLASDASGIKLLDAQDGPATEPKS